MKPRTLPVTIGLCVSLAVASGVPIGDMNSEMLGIEYAGSFSGQTITKAEVRSRFQAHYFMLRYAPAPWILISGGIGGSGFETEEYDSTRFRGSLGFSPQGELTLFTPRFAHILKVTGGCRAAVLNSADDDYRYTTILVNPYLGLFIAASELFDLGIGVKGHVFDGTMKRGESGESYSNNNYVHGYLSGTLHSLRGRAYATVTFDISPASSSDWSFGPNEAAISLQVGCLLKPVRESKIIEKTGPGEQIFRDIDTMRVQQQRMVDKMEEQD